MGLNQAHIIHLDCHAKLISLKKEEGKPNQGREVIRGSFVPFVSASEVSSSVSSYALSDWAGSPLLRRRRRLHSPETFGGQSWGKGRGRPGFRYVETVEETTLLLPARSRPPPSSRRCFFVFPWSAMQSQLVCNGCRSILLYPRGAVIVCCALCSTITSVPPPGMEMAQLLCGGCRTLLMHVRGATSVRCSCCHTMNLAPANQFAYINCGNCRTMLMYPCGAPSVKCALCQYVTSASSNPPATPIPPQRPESVPSSSTSSQTVVVENPMTVDESGKLVSNVVVGVTTEKKS